MMRRSLCNFAAATQRKQLLIAYGSQTGTAETFARMLGPMAVKHNFEPVICTLNDAVVRLGANSAAPAPDAMLCVCSTYGTGEFPSNAQRFADALEHGQLPKLKGVDYSVLGLGNSRNDAFNSAAKSIDKGLRATGAKPIVRMQLSCEVTQGHDTSYRNWKRAVWKSLGSGAADGPTPLTYETPQVFSKEVKHTQVLPTGFARAFVRLNQELTPKGYAPSTKLLTFQVPALEQIRRLGGRTATMMDNVLIMPKNSEALVQRTLTRLGVTQPTMVVEVTPLPGAAPSHFDHRKVTVHDLLAEVVDLSAIPSRSFLESLAAVATDAAECAHLEDLANDLSSRSEYDKLAHGVFSIADALDRFPSAKVSLAFLLTHAPHLQPRSYSIARDNADWKNDEFEVLYTVPTRVDPEDPSRKHEGITTSMIAALKTGDDVMVKFDVSPTRTMPSLEAPLFIVALGSGIGAARALLQRRRLAVRGGAKVGPATLFYGFRHAGKDELFAEELAQLEKDGVVTVKKVASYDGPTFKTPLDEITAANTEFLGEAGEVLYCGMGGSVPAVVEDRLRAAGVNVAAMRSSGRYHEEYFTTDLDTENLLHAKNAELDSSTLAGRMGSCNMFCMQCEQTFRGTGCTTVGVCGKTPTVAALQDLVIHQAKIMSFYASKLRELGAAEDIAANRLTLYALFTTLTNVNFDDARFVRLVGELNATIARLQKSFGDMKHEDPALPRGVPTVPSHASEDELVKLGKAVGVLTRFTEKDTQSPAAVAEMLTYGLKGLAAYTDHSLMNQKEDPAIYEYMQRALAWLIDPAKWTNLGDGLALCLECGKLNVGAMGLLYDSNKTLGVPSPHVVPIKPVPGKAILVSGHDLIMVEAVLKAAKPHGIKVYTHGELLPAHSYPTLRGYDNLAGHYGGAWMRQSLEFPHFPGPILMTTNCLTEPHETYNARIFTAGAVGWNGVTHLGNDMSDLKLDALIESALATPGFTEADKEFTYPDPVGQKRPAKYTVGFGHETIIGAAPTILEEINKGNITRFYLVGGCDGFEGQRSYYTDLAKNMPKGGVILTLGCGKFRVNHLEEELGTIGDTGLPRVLDMGQCNDSYSAVQVAFALAQALNCEVKDLPLSIVLSWFEQKAVAVLLSCLHLGLKPIHIGPALPAFVTPEVLQVLVNDFGVRPLGDAAETVKKMAEGPGMQ